MSETTSQGHSPSASSKLAPWPGSHAMPRWNLNELIDAPKFELSNLWRLIGPGLVMGGAAIGGGEWLSGPAVTAKYGAALLWVGTISIFFQVFYNIEISRYALYTGEPIFSGKLRILPGPWFWAGLYLLLDWGSVFPYLVANAAVPIEAFLLGRLPDSNLHAGDWWLHKILITVLWLLTLVPLLVGGKVYNSLRVVMTIKLILVIGFLGMLGVFFTRTSTWLEISSGLFKFGTVPVERAEDLNGNGLLDPGEDFDSDGRLDGIEPVTKDASGKVTGFEDLDHDTIRDGVNVDNPLVALWQGRTLPPIDLSMIAVIAALAAIAGNGGLTNTPISNFTRDQGWGMGYHVGAIPSVVGGKGIVLSHVGSVFEVNDQSLPRWRRWLWHVRREQWCVWLLACLIGISLPSILSVEFLQRGTDAKDWSGAAMTADGVRRFVTEPRPDVLVSRLGLTPWLAGATWGQIAWASTLLCGFLVLITSHLTTMDGFVRRWVDVLWTASPRMRQMKDDRIGYVYLTVLLGYGVVGLGLLWLPTAPSVVFQLSTTGYNLAFAISAWHTIVINSTLLPPQLRPGYFVRAVLGLAGCFYFGLFVISLLKLVGIIN